MKKTLSTICIVVVIMTLSACKTNMRRDVKRLTHKTEQCYSIVEGKEVDAEILDKFNSCYTELEELMNEYDKKYSDEKSSKAFSAMFIEEVRKSNMSDETKQMFENVYSLSNS